MYNEFNTFSKNPAPLLDNVILTQVQLNFHIRTLSLHRTNGHVHGVGVVFMLYRHMVWGNGQDDGVPEVDAVCREVE
jgi:hypothetical protein